MTTRKKRKRTYIPPANEVKHLEGGGNGRDRDTHVRTIQPSKGGSTKPSRGAGRTHELPVPSIRRTLKRLPIYFVLIFLLQFYLIGAERSDLEASERALIAAGQAGVVTLAFAPFMHIMDRWTYNRMQKRMGRAAGSKSSKRPGTKA